MASVVSIVNQALAKIGETVIVALTDDVKAARLANDTYEDHRDFVLDEHNWNFARARAQLAASSTEPVWGPDNAYPFPTDCIRPFLVNEENEFTGRWKVEGKTIVTNLGAPLDILYVSRVTDPNLMTPRFSEVLATYLAWQWVEAITGSDRKSEDLEVKYARTLATARSRDGREGTQEQLVSDEWITSRFRGGTLRLGSDLLFDPGDF